MRSLRLLAALSMLTLIAVGSSQAGPGTVVVRQNWPVVWWWWNDYEVTTIAFTSTAPDFYVDGFCNDNWPEEPYPPDFKLLTLHDLFYIASGKENFWFKGPLYTRVYGGFSSLDPSGDPWATAAWACDVLQGREGHLLADGISEFGWNDHNTCNLGPGQNTWDMRAVGTLTAQPGVCSSGSAMAKFDFTFHYMLTKDAYVDPATCAIDDPAHIRKVVIKGPDLKCIGK